MMVDTNAPDRALATLAILKVNQDEGRRHLDSYLPFVLHSLARTADEISTSVVQSDIESEFGIKLPQAVLKRLLDRAKVAGKVTLSHGVYRVLPTELADDNLQPVIADAERARGELIEGLRSFAKDRFDELWDKGVALDELLIYTDGFSSRVLAAALNGNPLATTPVAKNARQFVVHRFAADLAEANQTLFDLSLIHI